MFVANESAEPQATVHETLTASLDQAFSGTASTPGQVNAGTEEPSEDDVPDDMPNEESVDASSSDGNPGESAESKDAKPPGRWKRTQQKLKDAQAEAEMAAGMVQESVGLADFWQAESKALEADNAALRAKLEEHGFEQTDEQKKLEGYETQERRAAFKSELDKASQERKSTADATATQASFVANTTALAAKVGLGPREFAARALDLNLSPDQLFKQMQASSSSATSQPAVPKAPNTITRATGVAPRSENKPGSEAELATMLRATGQFI